MKILKKHWKKLIVAFLVLSLLGVLAMIIPVLLVNSYEKNIYRSLGEVENVDLAIVFGAGVKNNGDPSDALKDRLITVAEIYDAGLINKILVSGDNRFKYYNEPEAMRDYLVNVENIPSEDIVLDYAGRRTFDTCIRAKEIFQIDEALLVTQEYHLPRALFTCNSLGVVSNGFPATRQSYVFAGYYGLREVAAVYKAFIDVYIWEPSYLGGQVETIEF